MCEMSSCENSGLTIGQPHHYPLRGFLHAGLAGPCHTYLPAFPAFPICYFPLYLSAPGRSGVLEVSLCPSPVFHGDFINADTAHRCVPVILPELGLSGKRENRAGQCGESREETRAIQV